MKNALRYIAAAFLCISMLACGSDKIALHSVKEIDRTNQARSPSEKQQTSDSVASGYDDDGPGYGEQFPHDWSGTFSLGSRKIAIKDMD